MNIFINFSGRKTYINVNQTFTFINLIPYNPTADNDYQKPGNNAIMKFKYLLEHSGKKVTVRLERGADIDAACGQLKGKIC